MFDLSFAKEKGSCAFLMAYIESVSHSQERRHGFMGCSNLGSRGVKLSHPYNTVEIGEASQISIFQGAWLRSFRGHQQLEVLQLLNNLGLDVRMLGDAVSASILTLLRSLEDFHMVQVW